MLTGGTWRQAGSRVSAGGGVSLDAVDGGVSLVATDAGVVAQAVSCAETQASATANAKTKLRWECELRVRSSTDGDRTRDTQRVYHAWRRGHRPFDDPSRRPEAECGLGQWRSWRNRRPKYGSNQPAT